MSTQRFQIQLPQLAATVVVLALFTPALPASVVRAVGFAELSRSAAVVVAGRVAATEAVVDAESGNLSTRLRITLHDSIGLPSRSREWTIVLPGGAVDAFEQRVAGLPRIQAGDHVALFLGRTAKEDVVLPVGLWQGVFFADRDPATGQFGVRDSNGNQIMAVKDGALITAPVASSNRQWRISRAGLGLAEFMDAVRVLRGVSR